MVDKKGHIVVQLNYEDEDLGGQDKIGVFAPSATLEKVLAWVERSVPPEGTLRSVDILPSETVG